MRAEISALPITSLAFTSRAFTSRALTSRALTSRALTSRALTSLALASLVVSGCAATSIRSDLGRIEALTAQELPEDVLDAVDPEADARVADMLGQPLDADAAVRIAIANNRELRATLRDLGVERGRVLQAGLLPNPVVEFDVRQPSDRAQPLQIDLYAEYEITDLVLAPMRAEAAGHDLEAARYRAAGRVIETAYRARAAFHDAQAAEQRLVVSIRALDALAAARDAAVALFEAGSVPELDVATQIAAYEEARATTAELELERASARERLSRLLGAHGDATQWTIAAPLEAVPENDPVPDALERTAIESSLELAETRSRLQAIAQRVGLSRTEGWLPDVTVDVHGEQDGQAWEIGGGASFSVPIFDHGEGTTAAYEAQFDALVERYHGAAIDIRSAARDARNRLASARLRAQQYGRVIVPARRRVYQQTLLQYNAMQVSVFELVAALRGGLAAELAAIDSLRDYWIARAALEALVRGRRVGAAPAAATLDVASAAESEGGH